MSRGRGLRPLHLGNVSQAPGCGLGEGGTLDDSSIFGRLQMVILTIDKQSFHYIPDGLSVFERVPG